MLTVNVSTLTVDVKDVGSLAFDADAWSAEFVLSVLKFGLRSKIDQAKNKKKDATDAERKKAIHETVDKLRAGEWKSKATVAASLDIVEAEFRSMLQSRFVNVAKIKVSQAQADARNAGRFELFRDLVVKRQLEELGVGLEELEDRAKHSWFILQQKAQRSAEGIAKLRAEIENDDDV